MKPAVEANDVASFIMGTQQYYFSNPPSRYTGTRSTLSFPFALIELCSINRRRAGGGDRLVRLVTVLRRSVTLMYSIPASEPS